jgi:hypothetical protein
MSSISERLALSSESYRPETQRRTQPLEQQGNMMRSQSNMGTKGALGRTPADGVRTNLIDVTKNWPWRRKRWKSRHTPLVTVAMTAGKISTLLRRGREAE